MTDSEREQFKAEAARKQAAYERTVVPNMRRVADHYNAVHNLGGRGR